MIIRAGSGDGEECDLRLHRSDSLGRQDPAEGKDTSGKPVAISVDGKLENIGAYTSCFTAPGRRPVRASSPSRVISRL